jgi:predicted nucleic acid-binding protein
MKYLIDTDTLIDVLHDRDNVRQHVADLITSGAEVALCAITVAELYSGLEVKRRAVWADWLNALPYWDITRATAEEAGTDRKAAAQAGRTLQATDSLLAALARKHGATILTSNIKHYPHSGNKVLSLRKEAA